MSTDLTATAIVRLHALAARMQRFERTRQQLRSMSEVLGSGATTGAFSAFGWRAFLLVPVVVSVSALLSRIGRRGLAA